MSHDQYHQQQYYIAIAIAAGFRHAAHRRAGSLLRPEPQNQSIEYTVCIYDDDVYCVCIQSMAIRTPKYTPSTCTYTHTHTNKKKLFPLILALDSPIYGSRIETYVVFTYYALPALPWITHIQYELSSW